jgi:hypothetical protein
MAHRRLGLRGRAKSDSAKPTSRRACWEGHRLIDWARRSPPRRQIRRRQDLRRAVVWLTRLGLTIAQRRVSPYHLPFSESSCAEGS